MTATAATVEEFIGCFAEVSGRDFDPLHALVHPSRHAEGHGARRL